MDIFSSPFALHTLPLSSTTTTTTAAATSLHRHHCRHRQCPLPYYIINVIFFLLLLLLLSVFVPIRSFVLNWYWLAAISIIHQNWLTLCTHCVRLAHAYNWMLYAIRYAIIPNEAKIKLKIEVKKINTNATSSDGLKWRRRRRLQQQL